jgi:hypothetical protein
MDLVFEAAPLASNFVVVVSVKQTSRRLLICAVAAIIVSSHTWRLEAVPEKTKRLPLSGFH